MDTVTTPLSPEHAAAAAETSRLVRDYLQSFADGIDEFLLKAEGPKRFTRAIQLHVPAEALEILATILEQMGQGNSVQIMPVHAELTTQEAASLLNVSRPYVVKLIEQGALPARKVGSHRRIRLQDLLAFKEHDNRERQARLDELTRQSQELGLGYQ